MQITHSRNTMEPGTSTGAGWAAMKVAAAFGVPAMLAALLGLLILPPRTIREFTVRICTTVICSFVFGPLLAVLLAVWIPGLLDATHWMAERAGIPDFPQLGMLYLLGPCMLIAGLPSWWILGAYMRWTSRLQDEDAMDWLSEALRVFRGGDR